ncbi:transmembrane signal receptor [Lithospermum erythrorhizon]|uniref:Transmembrane signal receptor n=1 Tax=Lithospermum erythrorhizon TaxID=34254 RepID=A0AAV3R8Y5_LITER
MDVHNAFLYGDLLEEVYMKLPLGFEQGKEGKACRLRKSLYGMKQAPRYWFAKLVSSLWSYGFYNSYSDYSLFSYVRGDIQLHVLIYVDDLIISSNNSAALSAFKDYLSSYFHMKDLGVLKYFLGIEVARSSDGIYLCQRKYALDIITECDLLGGRLGGFPMEPNHKLVESTIPLVENVLSEAEIGPLGCGSPSGVLYEEFSGSGHPVTF